MHILAHPTIENMKFLAPIIVAFLVMGCAEQSQDGIEGKWSMHQIIQNGDDVTSDHNPFNDRYLIIKPDGTFESGGKPLGKNTGKYTLNMNADTLLLDSDVGPEDDSQWLVRVSNDTMYWQGFGTEWAENFQIIQVRKED